MPEQKPVSGVSGEFTAAVQMDSGDGRAEREQNHFLDNSDKNPRLKCNATFADVYLVQPVELNGVYPFKANFV